jgi:hypothetical protein
MDTRLTPLEKTEKPISITAEVARLARMTVPELRARHEELFGEVAKSHHKEFLARQIACRLQAEAEGGVPEETRQLALAVARDAPLRVRIESAAARGLSEADRTATILDAHHGDAKQSAFPNLTLPLLDQLQHQYERRFQIISLCDLVEHPEAAEEFIARDLTVDEVRNELLTLMVRLDQAIVTNPYGPPPQGAAEAATNSGGLPSSMVGPDPNEVPRKQEHEGSEVQPVDRLRRIHTRLGRSWDDTEARLWLLSDKLKLADLIREKALEWSERELVRLAAEEDQDGSATSPDTAPSQSEPRRRPGPKPNLEVGRQLAAIVQAHTDWKADLDDVCEELDEAGVTAPKRRDGRRYRGWLDALDIGDSSARDRVIKAIEYHLKKPRHE